MVRLLLRKSNDYLSVRTKVDPVTRADASRERTPTWDKITSRKTRDLIELRGLWQLVWVTVFVRRIDETPEIVPAIALRFAVARWPARYNRQAFRRHLLHGDTVITHVVGNEVFVVCPANAWATDVPQ